MSTAETGTDLTPTNAEKLRGLPWGVAWSVTNSVFAQYTFFGSVFVLFLNTLGLDKIQIGGLLSLFPFLGIVAVFIASAIARYGYKRTFITFMSARWLTAAGFLLTPWLLSRFGPRVTLGFIIFAVSAFSLFRAVAFTAFYPWLQEQVPDSMRGKYSAVKNALASLTAFVAMLLAGYVLGPDPDLEHFMILIAAGVGFGAVSIWTSTKIPGGAPMRGPSAEKTSYREMVAAVHDHNLMRYLTGVALVTLATVPLVSFVPLFMKEQVGLSADRVVWLETGVLMGGLISSYFWGWLADRYGSKPVMLTGVYLLSVLPVAWLVMPRQVPWAIYPALAIALFQGFFNTGWGIGSGRLLFVSVVPVHKRTTYMALYYAWAGIAGGLGQLLGGWMVDLTAGVRGQWWVIQFDPYTILFLVGIALPLVGYILFRHVRADSAVSIGQFAGVFLRGNPFLAAESLVRYHRARDERSIVTMTERMGRTKSPLAVEELLDALHDPRFYVRFEAIVSIARHRPDPRLTDALIETLEGTEPALSTMAAWGLGRIRDERAMDALRLGLNARYRSVQAHCARSLGSLGDQSIVPELLLRLSAENDPGLQLAFAAALGQLYATQAAAPLLSLLGASNYMDARSEFSLAIARLVGEEHRFIQLQRRVAAEPGTALSQSVTALKGHLVRSREHRAEIESRLADSAGSFAHGDLRAGVVSLCQAVQPYPADWSSGVGGLVISECLSQLALLGAQRIEYVVLLLHALTCAAAG